MERILRAEETTVLFESPERLLALLKALDDGGLSDRQISVCREVTKVHEEFFRGTPGEALRYYDANPPRGEVTVVIGPGSGDAPAAKLDLDALAGEYVAMGLAPSETAKSLAKAAGVTRQEAYAAVQRAKMRSVQ